MARSIRTWCVERNHAYYDFNQGLINKLNKCIEKVNDDCYNRYVEIDINGKEAFGMISALYTNSHFDDSSVPYEEIEILRKVK